MSRSADIDLKWADGDHRFRLAIGELRELQEKCDAGPPLILERLSTNRWRVEDVRETLRLGLIGGGATPAAALALIERYVDERPDWLTNANAAIGVLGVALVGAPEEAVGDKKKARRKTNVNKTQSNASGSLSSTATA